MIPSPYSELLFLAIEETSVNVGTIPYPENILCHCGDHSPELHVVVEQLDQALLVSAHLGQGHGNCGEGHGDCGDADAVINHLLPLRNFFFEIRRKQRKNDGL